MKKIVGIGANVCDTLISLPNYPVEDTKLRAEKIIQSGGGPCGTGLVAASKLSGNCAYIGALTDDSAGKFLFADLEKYGVSTELVNIVPGYTSFSSYIWLSAETTSRTCVFHKGDIPTWNLSDAQKQAVIDADILLIDGNDMTAALEAVKIARENGTTVLYDAGGLYEGVKNLLPYVDVLIPSEEYALGITGEKTAQEAAKKLYETYSPRVVVITQGKRGGLMYDGEKAISYPALPAVVVDSNGSGDVFHGAFAFALTKTQDYYKACIFSSAVSALKCTKVGSRAAVPTLPQVLDYLKEQGYDEFKEIME